MLLIPVIGGVIIVAFQGLVCCIQKPEKTAAETQVNQVQNLTLLKNTPTCCGFVESSPGETSPVATSEDVINAIDARTYEGPYSGIIYENNTVYATIGFQELTDMHPKMITDGSVNPASVDPASRAFLNLWKQRFEDAGQEFKTINMTTLNGLKRISTFQSTSFNVWFGIMLFAQIGTLIAIRLQVT